MQRPPQRAARWAPLLAALLALPACNAPTHAESTRQVAPGGQEHEVTIKASRELGTLKTRLGEEKYAGVMCSTCHSMPGDKPPATRPEELTEFHTGMKFTHGELTCNSCHNPDDRGTLRKADGTVVAFEDTMQLCAQCHGPQFRDYSNGAHGGMNGYWDLKQGPRVRNNCVNCHDPHDPAFPSMHSAPPPRDRFLGAPHGKDAHTEAGGTHR